MVDVDEGVVVLLGHELEFVFEGSVAIARDQSHMGEGTHLSGALATALFVALQEVAELLIVKSLLLLDRHDVLQRLSEVLQVQVQVLLVSVELADFFREDCNVTLLELFYDRKRGAVSGHHLIQLGLVLLLHQLVQVTLGSEEDLKLL